MRIGSLFSGIGGLDLGLEAAGVGHTVWQVETDEYCRAVLAKHWPLATRYDDVRTVTGAMLAPVDILCGGFPCQDVSLAGVGAGLAGARSGLWYEYLRLVGELRPRAVVIENVPGLIRRGLDTVVGGLVDLGYTVEASRIRASDVGAPHRRERVFVLAYRMADADSVQLRHEPGLVSGSGGTQAREPSGRREGMADPISQGQIQQGWSIGALGGRTGDGGMGNTDSPRLEVGQLRDAGQRPSTVGAGGTGDTGAAQSVMGRNADGLPQGLDGPWPAGRGEPPHEHEPPRTAHKVKQRAARLKALGNSVVPQCAYIAGMRLREWMQCEQK